jgi:protocatechuate 3,4-dioxygenase beta subunit
MVSLAGGIRRDDMKKLILVALAVVALGAVVALLVSQNDGAGDASRRGDASKDADAAGDAATADKSPDAAKKARSRAQAEAAPTLFVAGVVKTPDGKPVSGAVVDAFAVPTGEDVPDDERVGRPILEKMFGKQTGDRLWTKTKGMRDAVASGGMDMQKALDATPDMMSAGMEMLSDESGMDAIMSVMGIAREAIVADDAPFARVGGAASGADGTFKIEGLAAGRVELRAKAPLYVKTKTRVNAGDANVSIQLVRGARLAGVVTCEKEPVVGASVVVKGARTQSGAGGRFEFDAAHVPMEVLIVTAPDCVGQGRMVALSLDHAARDVAVELEPAGSIAGHVSSAAGGLVSGARVTITGSGGMMDLMAMGMGMGSGAAKFDIPPMPGVTDANGAFEMHGVKTGTVKVRVEADGYLAATVSVEVKKGQTSAVEALLVGESVLSGTVKDDKGAPVAGAKVRVEVPPRDAMIGMIATMVAGGTWKSAYADDKGAYEVHGLAEGERKVRVEAAKFLALEDKASLPAQGVATKLFTLHPGFKIAGTVVGPDGKPVAGAKIHATGKSAAGANPMMAVMSSISSDAAATSDADGKWTADGLPEGPYTVSASADGFLDGEASDVAAGKTDVALTLSLAATIRGRVVSAADMKPVAGAKVKHKSAADDKPAAMQARMMRGGRINLSALMGASVTCGADGAFEIKGLEPGEYELTGSMKGFANSEATKVRCDAGRPTEGIEIQLPAGVSVAGRVVEVSTGAAVADAVVWAGSGGGNPFGGFAMSDVAGGDPQAPADSISARTDAQGHFVLDGLSPGSVDVEVRAVDHAPTSSAGIVAPSADVLITIGVGGAVEGRVTAEDGTPLPGEQVMVGQGMGGGHTGKTDSKGDYRVERLPPGKYQLKLVDTKNMMSMFMPGRDSVDVKEGETVRHDFKKKGGVGRQFGGAALRDGKPIPNAMVFLSGGPGGFRTATTDENGHYSFDGLDAGEYRVVLQPNPMSGGNASKTVSVGSGGKIDDVPLEISSAKIEGDVTDVATGKGVAMAQVMFTDPGTKLSSSSDFMGGVRGRGFTDDRGHFSIGDMQNATFTMRVSAGEYVSTTVDGVVAGTTDVKVQLHRGMELAVTVLDADGHGVAMASVKSVDASGRETLDLDMTRSGFTDGNGVARLRLASGRYGLDVAADNFLPAHVDVDAAAGPATVVLQRGATLDVNAVDSAGVAVAGAKVAVKDASGKEISRGLLISGFMGDADVTDANGHYARGGLPAGAVTVVVTPPGRDPTSVDASLEANKPRHVDVVVK